MPINFHQISHYLRHFFVARRKGHGIHSPFAYQLCEEVFYNTQSFYDFELLDSVRDKLLQDNTSITVEDFGAGSKTFRTNTRHINSIAAKGISTRRQSEILYRLMNFLKCRNALELGTSLGLNTLYLAKVDAGASVTTIEGSKMLHEFAKALAQKNRVHNIRFIHAVFDEALPALLAENRTLDLLYVDGNHTREATLSYFKQALSKKHEGSVFIFDDIYWSSGMTEAWKELKAHPAVSLSIDAFHFGLLFFRPEIKLKVNLRLYL